MLRHDHSSVQPNTLPVLVNTAFQNDVTQLWRQLPGSVRAEADKQRPGVPLQVGSFLR